VQVIMLPCMIFIKQQHVQPAKRLKVCLRDVSITIFILGDIVEIIPHPLKGHKKFDHDIKYWQKMKDETTVCTNYTSAEFADKLQELKDRHNKNKKLQG